MTDRKNNQLRQKKTLEYELRRLYRAGELTDQQIAELKEAEFPFDTPVRRTAKPVVRIDDGKKWPSCSAAEKELGITQGWMSDVCNMAQNGKWVAIKNQFYCFESMYSPDMDLTEIRGFSCVFGAVIVYNLRSTPRALDILCLAVSWELMEKYIESRDIRFLFGFPFLGIFIANLHGALWPCAIMLPLAALLDSKLDSNARAALAVMILLTIASAMLNPYGLDVLSLPFKTIGTSDVATVAVPELKPMFSIVPVEAVILIVISVVPVIFHAKCLGFKKTVFSFETMMISGLLFLSLMTWRNELLLLGILMIVYSTWCWKLEPKCKASSKMLSRIVLFLISVVALEFGAVLFYSTLSATDQKSISIERAFQAMREDGAVSGTAVLTDIDPGCRAELNGFKPYLDTRIEVFNGQNGQKNVLAEAGKALSSGSLSAICDDYGMDYAVLNYGINDVGIQDLKESGFKTLYSDGLTACLKRSTV